MAYQNSIKNFLQQADEEILGILTMNEENDLTLLQKNAWLGQIELLKSKLVGLEDGFIVFEYTIPRIGRRIDNVLIIRGNIFVLEFKVGTDIYNHSSVVQARTYALDLRNFHEQSHNANIIPILIATDAPAEDINLKKYKDSMYDVILSNGENLDEIITKVLECNNERKEIPLEKWVNSRYLPTPTIIEAAQIMYNNHSVEEISQNEAAENLTKTTKAIQDIIEYSKTNNKKSICFVTGVPGAGKTLAGLNIAIQNQKSKDSCFLSGNQPLVSVLKEALVKDEKKRKKEETTSEARAAAESFIQIIHHFRDESLNPNKLKDPPSDKVVVFDEAQRAWTQEKLSKFMNEKKSQILMPLPEEKKNNVLKMSEPELLIDYMNRHKDYAVIVCLVGGGQDINDGEAGIKEWFDSLKRSFKDWAVYVSSGIKTEEYISSKDFEENRTSNNYEIVNELHLSVSLRSYRSEKVSDFVKALIDNEKEEAKKLYKEISEVYPIYMTRDLGIAKAWVKNKAKDNACRYGIIASSKAKRLRSEGIWVECKCTPKKWFLTDGNDIKSSYYMEEVATEFDIQGLEIDWAIVAWDADYRYEDSEFKYYKPRGSIWNNINKDEEKRYLKNAYRVLLTRAREGFILFVPKGDDSDKTRLCTYYDELWNYLTEVGIRECSSLNIESI